MMGTGLSVLWAFVPLMLATVYFDLRHLRLPNAISLLLVLAFVLWAPFVMAPTQIGWRVLAAAIVFGLGFAAFAAGLVGGGDVKVLGAVMLFVPPLGLPMYFLAFGLCLLSGTALVLALRKSGVAQGSDWRGVTATGRFPVGLAIGGAALVHVVWHGPLAPALIR